jgi:diadenosine tetraphosphate (Ap4A) HIT family hydrolase
MLPSQLEVSEMSDCTLCDLVSRTLPVNVAYEDSSIFAFVDIHPAVLGNIVIIPKKHVVYLAELDEATGVQLLRVTMRIAQAVRNCGVKCEAVNLLLADGKEAGQEEFHVHMHVIPRYVGDNFIIQPDYQARPTQETLGKIAERIQSQVGTTHS